MLNFSLLLGAYSQNDSVCYTSQENEAIALMLMNCEDLKIIHRSLEKSYEDAKLEIKKYKDVVSVHEKERNAISLKDKKLKEELSKAVLKRRSWRKARTQIALLINE